MTLTFDKVLLSIRFPASADALQPFADFFVRSLLPRACHAVINQPASRERNLTLPLIEIDLGVVKRSDFERVFLQRFTEVFFNLLHQADVRLPDLNQQVSEVITSAALPRPVSAVSAVSAASAASAGAGFTSGYQPWQSYLVTGLMSVPIGASFPARAFLASRAYQQANFFPFIRAILPDPQAAKRLFYLLKRPLRRRLLHALVTTPAERGLFQPLQTDPLLFLALGLYLQLMEGRELGTHQLTALQAILASPLGYRWLNALDADQATAFINALTPGVKNHEVGQRLIHCLAVQEVSAPAQPAAPGSNNHATAGSRPDAPGCNSHATAGSRPDAPGSNSHATAGSRPDAPGPNSHATVGAKPAALSPARNATSGEKTSAFNHHAASQNPPPGTGPIAHGALANSQHDSLYLPAAGSVLVWAMLPSLFNHLWPDGLDEAARHQAVLLLDDLLWQDDAERAEWRHAGLRLLCGLEVTTPLADDATVSDEQKQVALEWLHAVVERLPFSTRFGSDSDQCVATLRQLFLCREGELIPEDTGWRWQVEPQAWDGLLNQLPWPLQGFPLQPALLPWLDAVITIDWELPAFP